MEVMFNISFAYLVAVIRLLIGLKAPFYLMMPFQGGGMNDSWTKKGATVFFVKLKKS
jgi:hypothetical protein